MLSKKILLLIGVIFVLHFAASMFYWYSSIWYFDMPMHFMGGFFLGLAFFWYLWPDQLSTRTMLPIVAGVLVVGVGWEVFELIFINVVAANSFHALDTFSDICFDLAGGFTALLYASAKIIKNTEVTI